MRYTNIAAQNQNNQQAATIVDFTNGNFPQMTLLNLTNGDTITEVTVVVLEVFDGGATMSLGFPADTDEIAPTNKIKLQKIGVYKFFPYRKSTISETLNAYFSGSSTTGSGKIYIFR